MTNPPIAIMQGRLSPPQGTRIQFFPKDWEAEFALAKTMGFASLSWFLDRDIPDLDPIADIWGSPAMLDKIDAARSLVPITGVDCGRYALFGPDKEVTLKHFPSFLNAVGPRLAGTKVVVLPLLVDHAPKTAADLREVQETLSALLPLAAAHGVTLALETELPAKELADVVDGFESPWLGVCYDIGSATAYGFDCPADLRALGTRVVEVHLKDHKRGHVIGKDTSVMLGTGDADFAGCFAALKDIKYRGGYTIQAWRGADYISDAQTQLAFITHLLQDIHGSH